MTNDTMTTQQRKVLCLHSERMLYPQWDHRQISIKIVKNVHESVCIGFNNTTKFQKPAHVSFQSVCKSIFNCITKNGEKMYFIWSKLATTNINVDQKPMFSLEKVPSTPVATAQPINVHERTQSPATGNCSSWQYHLN